MTKDQLIRGLQWPVWFVVMSIVMGALNRSRMKKQINDQPNLMRVPFGILVFGVLSFGFLVAIAVLSQIFPGADGHGAPLKQANPLLAVIFLGFASMAAPCIVAYFIERHTIGEDALEYRTMTKRGVLPWSDITNVGYSPSLKWFRLKTKGNRTVRISATLTHLPEFALMLLQKVPARKIDLRTHNILMATAAGNPPSLWR